MSMKKIIYLLLCFVILLSCKKEEDTETAIIKMDTYSAYLADSMYGYEYIKVKNHITNLSDNNNYIWEIVSISNTDDFYLLICDPVQCCAPNTMQSSFTLAKDSTGLFEVGLMNKNNDLTEENRIIEKVVVKVLIYPEGDKEKAITYEAIIDCI